MADQPRRVLYVEDDPSNQALMRCVIGQRPDVQLVVASDGTDALDKVEANRPDLVLLDRNFTGMTASEFLPLLRLREGGGEVPVVIVSGDSGRPRSDESSLGVIGYLTKPYEIPQLLGYLDRALGPPAPSPVAIDERAAILVVDDDEVARTLVAAHFRTLNLRNRVVTVPDGQAAIELLAEGSLDPVLVLLDLEMPRATGIDVLTWVRSQPHLADLPVVVLSSSDALEHVEDVYALGVHSYLVKPVGFGAIKDVLQQLGLPWALLPRGAAR